MHSMRFKKRYDQKNPNPLIFPNKVFFSPLPTITTIYNCNQTKTRPEQQPQQKQNQTQYTHQTSEQNQCSNKQVNKNHALYSLYYAKPN
jgi:FMN-dependent NADH-azoreductase